jgi:hypothetical protein
VADHVLLRRWTEEFWRRYDSRLCLRWMAGKRFSNETPPLP